MRTGKKKLLEFVLSIEYIKVKHLPLAYQQSISYCQRQQRVVQKEEPFLSGSDSSLNLMQI